jgi:hypothetical protein
MQICSVRLIETVVRVNILEREIMEGLYIGLFMPSLKRSGITHLNMLY